MPGGNKKVKHTQTILVSVCANFLLTPGIKGLNTLSSNCQVRH